MQIDLIDVGCGNLSSIKNSLSRLQIECKVITSPRDLRSDVAILPGVGSVGAYMSKLNSSGFSKKILSHVASGRRIFGICLGFQVLYEHSQEDGGIECLSLLKGNVVKLPNGMNHNCWEPIKISINDFTTKGHWGKLYHSARKIIEGRVFYNHEYGIKNYSRFDLEIAVSPDLSNYTGFLVYRNIVGVQFHPEKSQKTGQTILQMLR